MAIKHICDRCGEVCKPKTLFKRKDGYKEIVLKYEVNIWGEGRRSYELCYNCAQHFVKFMNDPKPMHIPKMEEEENG